MSNNAEDFDLLSAALNESGLTGDLSGFGDGEFLSSANTSVQGSDSGIRAGGDVSETNAFTQALKQLAATSASTPKQVSHSVSRVVQHAPLQNRSLTPTIKYVAKAGLSGASDLYSANKRNVIVRQGPVVLRTGLTPQSYTQKVQSLSTGQLRSSSPVPGAVQIVRVGNTLKVMSNATQNLSPSLANQNIAGTFGNGPIRTQLTNRDVSRLWSNEDIKYKNISRQSSPGLVADPEEETNEEEIEEEDEELGHAETYADYMPSKLRIGYKHPDPVVETSSLSSVEPPDIRYKLSLPEKTIDYADLSALQLEAIVYACQRHEEFLPSEERAGFLIGDGAGVGKGRTIAGIIFENYMLGRKRAIWLSVSNDLRVDAERDLRDIGAGKIDVHPLNKFKYGKISSKDNSSVKKGVIFATYSSLIGESQSGGKYSTRMKQLLHWCGKEFDGLIVFDECHKAKNLCPTGSSKPTKTGMAVLDLQNKLPKARIVYASATGATEPRNMAYMARLGLWGTGTPFKEFLDFIQAVEKRGVGAMELVAMDMKLRGMYIARQLSFHGVTFKVEEIPVNKDAVKVYNAAVKLWCDAREKFQTAADLIDAEKQMRKSMWGQFWSAHQRFFKYLCISAKVPFVVKLARDAVRNDKCVVIGLQSTGEARTLEQLEEQGELTDFVSTAKGVFQSLVEKHFPAPNTGKVFDLFGIGKSIFDELRDSNPPSPKTTRSGQKRKRGERKAKKGRKRYKEANGASASDSDGSQYIPTSESESESDTSSSDSDDSMSEDDVNPFGSNSDSDNDSWIQKSKKSKKKKKKKSKSKKKSKPKKDKESFDDKFDKALEAAGLKAGNKPLTRENSSSSLSSMAGARFNPLAGTPDGREKAQALKQELLEEVDRLGDRLPPNTLDELIDSLGGTDSVAEMTGRKGRVVTNEDGNIQYESRSEFDVPLETLNLTEKQRFMDGEKYVAIISEAASSGISLQADRRAVNQKRRVHITLELPWSADRAIQQFGRTHRSNQVNAPEYVFMISELAGERRFASTVAKRLESLGALTHGDRRATETRDLSRFNFDNKFGRAALEGVMKSVADLESPMVPPPKNCSGDFFEGVRQSLVGVGLVTIDPRLNIPLLEKDYNSMSKFLNRILGIEVELQNQLFQYFMDTLDSIILQAKRNGKWDLGILDLGSGSENVKVLECRQFVAKFVSGSAKTELQTISVERGLSWQQASDIWRDNSGQDDGFYISSQSKLGKGTAVLAIAHSGTKGKREKFFHLYRPNTGRQLRAVTLANLKKKYKKVVSDQAESLWSAQYESSSYTCSHAFWKGNCKRISLGMSCEIGLRTRTYHVLSGSVLSVWNKVESVLASMPGGHNSKMQIVRLRTEDGRRLVGSLIPSNCVDPLCNVLRQDDTFTEIKDPPKPQPTRRPPTRPSYQPPQPPKTMAESSATPSTPSTTDSVPATPKADILKQTSPPSPKSPPKNHIFDESSDEEEKPAESLPSNSTIETNTESANLLSMPMFL